MTAVPKLIRHVDKKVLARVRKRRCLVCGDKAMACHVWTVGSYGPDADFNVIPMCFSHHTQQGWTPWPEFMALYPRVERELREKGWYIGEDEKFWHDELPKYLIAK